MFGYLLSQAGKDLVALCVVQLLVERKDTLLLLEEPLSIGQGFYELPSGFVKQEESFQQAIQRILVQEISLSLKKVIKLLTYRDSVENQKKKRDFYFIVEVNDPEDITLSKHHGFAWKEPAEAVGYPIREDLREILDLYMKIK